jgi:hypothetical protein
LDSGQTRLERFEGILDAFGHLEGAGAGELLHDEHQSRTAENHRIADQWLVVDGDRRDIGQAKVAIRVRHRHFAEFGGVGDLLQQVPHL